MSRDINTNVYTGEHTLNAYAKYTDNFYQCVANGTLLVNKALNDSCYLGYCINDTLTVPRFVKIINDNGTIKIGDKSAVRLPVNNYMLTVNGEGSVFTQNIIGIDDLIRNGSLYGQRMGEGATEKEIPKIAPCTHIATTNCVLLIKCQIAQYYTIGDVYKFNNIQTYDYDDIVSEPDSYWDNHACLAMWAEVYIGDSVSRSISSVGVSASMGGTVIDVPLIDSNTVYVDGMPSTKLLQSIYNMAASGACLYQGSLTDMAVSDSTLDSNGKNKIFYLPFCNPTFWDIVYSNNGSGFIRFRPAILDKLRFMSAFRAYNCTGLLYTGNVTDASHGDPLQNDNVVKAKISNDGKISPDKLANDKSEGLASNPDDMYTATGFNGNEDIDPNNYVEETPLSAPKLSPVGIFNRTFAMTSIQLRALADFLWNADDDKMTEIIKGLELYGENPLNGLIDCRLYPFDLSPLSTASQDIIVGRVNTHVGGRLMQTDAKYVINLGKCTFKKYFNNFLDYSPYTTGRLFIPYCGMAPIDTSEFMGHEISAKLIVDVITGACCCCIYRDGILIITANGICGCEISMSGTDSASYASAMVNQFANAIVQTAGGIAGMAGGAALAERMGGAGMGAGGASVVNGLTGFWNMKHTPTQYAQRGSSSPCCETWLPQYPYFIIDRPIPNIPNGYGHNVGFACIETGPLSNFSGFTICSNVDTSGFAQATEAERNELKMLLEAGVFL